MVERDGWVLTCSPLTARFKTTLLWSLFWRADGFSSSSLLQRWIHYTRGSACTNTCPYIFPALFRIWPSTSLRPTVPTSNHLWTLAGQWHRVLPNLRFFCRKLWVEVICELSESSCSKFFLCACIRSAIWHLLSSCSKVVLWRTDFCFHWGKSVSPWKAQLRFA